MSRFVDFLADTAVNVDSFTALMQNPDKTMAAAGLTEEEQTLLRNKNWYQMAQYVIHTDGHATIPLGQNGMAQTNKNNGSKISW